MSPIIGANAIGTILRIDFTRLYVRKLIANADGSTVDIGNPGASPPPRGVSSATEWYVSACSNLFVWVHFLDSMPGQDAWPWPWPWPWPWSRLIIFFAPRGRLTREEIGVALVAK